MKRKEMKQKKAFKPSMRGMTSEEIVVYTQQLREEILSRSTLIKDENGDIWMIHNDDYYLPIENIYKNFPITNGCPKYNSISTTIGGLEPPKSTKYPSMINHPIELEAPDILVTGGKGSGKSQFLTKGVIDFLALGYKGLVFDSMAFESRHFAWYGYYDKNLDFHPFQITVWIPSGIELDYSDGWGKLWEMRNNVHLREWKSITEIVDNLSPHTLNVVWDDCFDYVSKVRLFYEITQILVKKCHNPAMGHSPVLLICHEWSKYFDSHPEEEYKIVKLLAKSYVDWRKYFIATFGATQFQRELYWRIGGKETYVVYKAPYYRKDMSPAEEYALGGDQSVSVISHNGFYCKHFFGALREMADTVRIVQKGNWLTYPEFEEWKPFDNKIKITPRMFQVLYYAKDPNLSVRSLAKDCGLTTDSIYKYLKRFDDLIEEVEAKIRKK